MHHYPVRIPSCRIDLNALFIFFANDPSHSWRRQIEETTNTMYTKILLLFNETYANPPKQILIYIVLH